MTANGTTTNYTYNTLDQLVSTGSATYNYNRRGDLTSVTNGTNVATYTWDARDRMIGASVGGQNVSFAYDASGHRIQQVANGQTTNYLWDEFSPYGDVTLETNGNGATLVNYTLGGTELLAQNRGGTISYYLHDAYGNLQSHSGNTVNSYQ